MAVNFEAAASVATGTYNQSASTTIVLGGASSTRAVLIGLAFEIIGVTGVTVTIGGQSAALISGTDTGSNNSSYRTMLFGIATSLAGTQTISVSWTSNSAVAIGAISATGVNQATPFNNGTFFYQNNPPELTYSLSVTSTSGDLTSSLIQAFWSTGTTVTNQTEEWSGSYSPANNVAADIGPGTGTTTHTWSNASGIASVTISGANFVQQTAAALSSSIAGHATVVGALKGKGVLADSVTGHATISAHIVGQGAYFSNIYGHATLSANLSGGGGLVGRFSKIILSWTAATDQVDGYDVFRGPTPGGESTVPLNGTLILSTTYTDASPLPGNNFYVVKSSLGGVLSQITNEEGILSAGSNINGHAIIVAATSGTNKSLIVSAVHGHATVLGTIKAAGKLVGSAPGHVTIAGHLAAKGVLVGVAHGHATSSGHATAKGFIVGAAHGHATIFASIQNAPIHGTSSVTAGLKAKGVLASALAAHSTLTAVLKAKGVLASAVNGTATLFASIQNAPIHGTSSVSAVLTAKGIRTSAVTGHATVSGTAAAKGVLVGVAHGHATIFASIQNVPIHGHATVTALLKAKGILATAVNGITTIFALAQNAPIQCQGTVTAVLTADGALAAVVSGDATISAVQHSPSGIVSGISGAATVTGHGTAAFGKINGRASVAGLPKGAAALIAACHGHSTVVANLGSISLQGCFGQAFLFPKLTASALLSAHCSGHSTSSAAASAAIIPKAAPAFGGEVHGSFTFLATNPNLPFQTNAKTGQTAYFTINEPDNRNGSSTVIVPESNQPMSVTPPPDLQIIGGLVLDQFGNLTVPVNKGAMISGVVAGGSVLENPG